MQIHNIEQGTPEWFALRRGVATASNFDRVVTSTGKESAQLAGYALQLASQLLSDQDDEMYTNADMERGIILEAEARQVYQETMPADVTQAGFITNYGHGYSPDGLIGDDGLIEIKCPKQNTHTKYLYQGKVPSDYYAQVQGGLYITGRSWCDFISYHPNFGERKLFIFRSYRDEEFIGALAKNLEKLAKQRDDIVKKIRG